MNKIIFRTNGGLGKQILATRIASMIREKYPKAIIHVQTSYPEAFANLDFIDRYFAGNVPYFYTDHMDFDVLETEIYVDLKYRQAKEHAIETWCRKLNLPKPKILKGIITLDNQEKSVANKIIMQQKIDTNKLIAFQPFGSVSYYNPEQANNPTQLNTNKNLPVKKAQEIVNKLVELGYMVLQISLPTEPQLQNTFKLTNQGVLNPRYLFAVLNLCKYGIFIDSFAQHAWAALGKENALVMWGSTNPINLGYETNINIVNAKSCRFLHCNRPCTHLGDIVGNGNVWKCLYNTKCMDFKTDFIIEKFLSIVDLEKQNENNKNET